MVEPVTACQGSTLLCSAVDEGASPTTTMCLHLQSLMERALAGKFDRSLKFGHSSGIWQVNDKGWEDDETHIDFDVSGTHTRTSWSLPQQWLL